MEKNKEDITSYRKNTKVGRYMSKLNAFTEYGLEHGCCCVE